MDFYTVVLRKSNQYMVALCLENGITSQGNTRDEAIRKLREAIESFEDAQKEERDIYSESVSIKELHEFLTIESQEIISERFELRAVYA